MARGRMSKRAEWSRVLDAEVARWSQRPWEQLLTELQEGRAYQVEVDSKPYQVEVVLLENTQEYVHVIVAVDDGTLPRSLMPLTHSFVKQKNETGNANSDWPHSPTC